MKPSDPIIQTASSSKYVDADKDNNEPDLLIMPEADEPEDDMYGDEFSPTIVPDTSFMEHMDQVSVLFL